MLDNYFISPTWKKNPVNFISNKIRIFSKKKENLLTVWGVGSCNNIASSWLLFIINESLFIRASHFFKH